VYDQNKKLCGKIDKIIQGGKIVFNVN